MDLPTPQQFASSEPPHVFPALEALHQYSILLDGARVDGPDYIPCEWTADLLLQDIPWGHLPLICAFGRPLDFIPTSHILKVRRVFTHCLQAVLASPLEELLWKRFCLLRTVYSSTSVNVAGPTSTARSISFLRTLGLSSWMISPAA